ncbi:hypothetical protein APY94_00860 [Thermococcus celericrescens]|uniref:DUF2178 domain-containing protein n=1 Tax=Thermococcus celericrescens TaxID=227598 RepID=A0A100XZT3_9EURY|nr:hypothetical protein [Thermococcus celericrescens]KUH34760.1 hypothetical protein APY94_00860 [Thermococcus celericrescens]
MELTEKWVSVAVACLAAFLVLWWRTGWEGSGALLAAIFALIVANLFLLGWKAWEAKKERGEGFSSRDEVTLYVEGRAAYYAMNAGLWFMLALLWYMWGIHVFGLSLPEPSAPEAITMSALFMALLFLGLKWKFGRTGNLG